MKFFVRTIKISLFLLLAFILGGFVWWKVTTGPVNRANRDTIPFVIEKGEGVSEISLRLKESRLINNSLSFRITTYLLGITRNLQAGDYFFSPSMSVKEIASALTKGKNDVKVTIIEGLRQEEVGELLVEAGFTINLSSWQKEITSQNLEGKLFPDTYFFPKRADQETILKIIEKNYLKKVIPEFQSVNRTGLAPEQILALASIVEREVSHEADRKIVAGILLKRWQNAWPLQADATVQYALATQNAKLKIRNFVWWPKNLTKNDLQINSSYNTYRNRGLPPGPICSPGLSAIKAVINYEDSPYWFYLSDARGQTHYAKTDAEQAENIRIFLR